MKYMKIFILILLLISVQTASAISAFDIRWGTDLTSNMRSNTLKQWAESMEGQGASNIGTGKIWYVDSGVTAEGDGSSWTNARNLLQDAVDASSADGGDNRGDVIKVAQAHSESVATAAVINIDVAGITIEGAGSGEDQPEFSLSANLSTFQVSAADVTLYNLRFLSTKTSGGVAQGIDVTADGDGFRMIGCEIRETSVDTEFVKALNLTADADECVIIGNRFVGPFASEGTGGDAVAITLEGGSDQTIIAYNYFNGDWSDYVIKGTGAQSLNLLIQGNIIHNYDTGAGKTMGFEATTTGDIVGNSCYGNGSAFACVADAMFVSPDNIFMATENVETRNFESMLGAFTGAGGAGQGASIYADMVLAQTDLDAIISSIAGLSTDAFRGQITTAGATTLVQSTALAGFGDGFFVSDYVVAVTYTHDAGAPLGEIRDISAYTSTGGIFTVTAFSAALATTDKVAIIRRENLAIDGVALQAAPATGSLANYIAGTGTLGTDLGTAKSLVDALGTDGVVLADDAVAIAGIIGIPTDADNAVDSTNIVGNADGSVYERLEDLLTDTTLILADTGTAGVVVVDNGITAAKIATDAITADKIAANSITSAEIASDAIGSSELATTAVREIAEPVNQTIIGETRKAGGNIYYVDNNGGSDAADGMSWDTAFLTIAKGMLTSHTNIATSPNYADRNTIYVRGDDFAENWTDLAQKTDIIGVGSDDFIAGVRVIGHHTIDAAATGYVYGGCRFFNMSFSADTAGGIFTIPTGHHGMQWINCNFDDDGTYATTYAIHLTIVSRVVIDGCTFNPEQSVGTGFSVAAIQFAAGACDQIIIRNNLIDEAAVGILTDASTTGKGCWCTDNYISTTGETINDAGSVFKVINNRLITETDTATTTAGYTFDLTKAAGNLLTGSTKTDQIPFISESE